MGNGAVKVNKPDVWKQSGKGLSEVGEQTKKAWEKLKGESQGMGDIFGDDMVGGLLGSGYNAIFESADEAFTTSADDYEAFGTAMRDVGQNHEDNESRNADMILNLGQMGDG